MSAPSREKCRSCPVETQCRDSFRSWIYFFIFLTSVFAMAVALYLDFLR